MKQKNLTDKFDLEENEVYEPEKQLEIPSGPMTEEEMRATRAYQKTIIPNVLRTIENIEKKSLNHGDATFTNLYKLLYDPELLYHALGNVMNRPGALAKGIDNKNTDIVGMKFINKIAKDIKTEQFIFSPIRRIFIDKTGKKSKDANKEAIKFYLENKLTKEKQKELKIRPLGILTTKDKIISESIRIILNAIYEPEFKKLELNFGFRPSKGCHDAINRQIRYAKAHSFAIEADITGAFDNVNHNKLIEILEKKIKDKRLLKLIKDGLKVGIFFAGRTEEAKIGTVQGSNISPLLYNIYFHEFDKYIATEFTTHINQLNKTERRIDQPANPQYTRITKAKAKLKRNDFFKAVLETYQKFGKDSTQHKKAIENWTKINEQYKQLDKKQKNTTRQSKNRKTLRFTYTRYADDWIFTSNASKSRTIEFKEMFSNWIKDNLLLELSESKTKITPLNSKTNKVKFLGFNLCYYSDRNTLIRKITPFKTIKPFVLNRAKSIKVSRNWQESKAGTSRRIATPSLICSVDKTRLLPRLIEARFIKKKRNQFFGRSKAEWTTLQLPEIINRYNQIIRGYINYYAPCLSYTSELNFILYLLQYSCLHTIANKLNSSIKKTIKKFGKYPKITWKPEITQRIDSKTKVKINTKETTTELISWNTAKQIILQIIQKKTKTPASKYVQNNIDDICTIKCNWRTKFKLSRYCSICGSTENINYHHVRHIKIGKTEGFLQVMKQLNRKQIPCCEKCHQKIHKGLYNGLKLSDLYDERLIIV